MGIRFALYLNELLIHRHSRPGSTHLGLKRTKRSDPNKYEYQVTMSCGGCAKTVEKALKELEGITSYEILLEQQKVEVVTSLPSSTVLETLLKTGKKVVPNETS